MNVDLGPLEITQDHKKAIQDHNNAIQDHNRSLKAMLGREKTLSFELTAFCLI